MKTSFPVILKNAWPYGLILGAISVVISLLLYIFNVNLFSIAMGIFSFLVFVLAIPVTFAILGGNNLRLKHKEDRTISYLDAVINTAIILLIGFLISNLYSYIFNTFIDPDYIKVQMAKMVDMLSEYNLPQEDIDKSIASAEKRMGLGSMLLNSVIITAVLSLLLGLIIRKKDKVDEKIV